MLGDVPVDECDGASINCLLVDGSMPVTALTRLLKLGYANNVTVASMRFDPDWDPWRKDPRFEALLESGGAGAAKA